MPTFVKTHKVNISPTTFNNVRMLNTEISAAVAAMSLQSCPTLFDPIDIRLLDKLNHQNDFLLYMRS